MGRKLTEQQKVERAAKKLEAKDRDALGPLFKHEAQPVDRDSLLQERRWGWARSVIATHELIDAHCVLDALYELQLRELAAQFIPAEIHAQLVSLRNRTYPPNTPSYGIQFWKEVLWGERVVFRWKLVPDPSIKIGGKRLVEDGVWPPEGWQPPFPKGEDGRSELHGRFWRKCHQCGYWHAPGQKECTVVMEVTTS